MEDAELDILMEEVSLRTPTKESTESLIKVDKVKSDDGGNKLPTKKVLVTDASITKSENVKPIFEETRYDEYEAMLNESTSDEEDEKVSIGTSNRIAKKYRITMIEQPSLVCGRVLSQGAAFCLNKNCTITTFS